MWKLLQKEEIQLCGREGMLYQKEEEIPQEEKVSPSQEKTSLLDNFKGYTNI